jgi:hypothetical protein
MWNVFHEIQIVCLLICSWCLDKTVTYSMHYFFQNFGEYGENRYLSIIAYTSILSSDLKTGVNFTIFMSSGKRQQLGIGEKCLLDKALECQWKPLLPLAKFHHDLQICLIANSLQ